MLTLPFIHQGHLARFAVPVITAQERSLVEIHAQNAVQLGSAIMRYEAGTNAEEQVLISTFVSIYIL